LHDITKRPDDLVARYGGEEFVILLPETSSKGAATLAKQVREAIEALQIEHGFNDASKYVTISLGVATQVCSCGKAENELVARADKALYASKKKGRNIITLFDEIL
jgi:diguanylate cyclase (GGDEF)-like protein